LARLVEQAHLLVLVEVAVWVEMLSTPTSSAGEATTGQTETQVHDLEVAEVVVAEAASLAPVMEQLEIPVTPETVK
jgi:hypothetical protein